MKNVNLPVTVCNFKEALLRLDINALEALIDNDIHPFGTTKEIFLNRLAYIFNQHKLSHDSHPPEIIQSKKNPNAFKIKFKLLEDSVKFIFEESDRKITRIYNNKRAVTKDEVQMLSPSDMIFGDDEKPDFKPSVDYLINLNKSKSAVFRLKGSKQQIFNSAELKLWLVEYEELKDYTSMNFKYFKFIPFNDLYFGIHEIINQLDDIEIVMQANREIDKLTVMAWLEKYNRLFYCRIMGFDQIFHLINFEEQIIQYDRYSNLWFTGDDFFEMIKFCRLYNKNSDLLKFNRN